MSAQNIPMVGITSVSIMPVDSSEEKRHKAGRSSTVSDHYSEGNQGSSVAESAEAPSPKTRGQDAHARLKSERSNLIKAMQEAGIELKSEEVEGEKLTAFAQKKLEELDGKILKSKSDNTPEFSKLVKNRDALEAALQSQQKAVADVAVEMTGATGVIQTPVMQAVLVEENKLWTELEGDLGVKIFDKDGDQALKKIAETFGAEMMDLHKDEQDLKAQIREVEAKLKKASPEQAVELKKNLEKIQKELQANLMQQKTLHQKMEKANQCAEKIITLQAKRELGIESIDNEELVASEDASTANGSQVMSAASTSKTSSTTTSGASPMMKAASSSKSNGASQSVFHTASDGGDAVSQSDGTFHEAVAFSAATDYTGTTLSIASQGGKLKAETARTKKLLDRLLAAAASGNYEALKAGMVVMGQRASQIMINVGVVALKGSLYYEQQMQNNVKMMGRLSADDPAYSSTLATMNSQMNLYSMNRQSLFSILQMATTMKEEIMNQEHSFLQADQRLSSALAKF